VPIGGAYEAAVNAMYVRPEACDALYGVVAPHLRNPPALAWALLSNPDNAKNLDGLAFQKLPTAKYQQVGLGMWVSGGGWRKGVEGGLLCDLFCRVYHLHWCYEDGVGTGGSQSKQEGW
jgi:hypothetical protein